MCRRDRRRIIGHVPSQHRRRCVAARSTAQTAKEITMENSRFDLLARRLTTRFRGVSTGRRSVLQGAVGVAAATFGRLALHDEAAAKTLCRRNGTRCKKKGKRCRAEYCLKTPFTIEAHWSNPNTDHDTFLFVPNQAGSNLPAPWISVSCNLFNSDCEDDVYPFTCVGQDAQGPGNEITTIRQLLPGTYEYWIGLPDGAPLADLAVQLRNANGRLMRTWISPANPSATDGRGWHVFDIDGANRSITSVDKSFFGDLPLSAHIPYTNVCPVT
jgi:hypothetical protein